MVLTFLDMVHFSLSHVLQKLQIYLLRFFHIIIIITFILKNSKYQLVFLIFVVST